MSTSVDSTPRFSADDGVATITLCRPAHRNSLHNEDLAMLLELFRRIDGDRAIRVVVLTAEVLAGRPIFSAGYNADEFSTDEVLREAGFPEEEIAELRAAGVV